ncbi:MAG: hypothetical protein FWF29_03185 [Treponema sp.]|nr:hypothetical protein [Treponema sp.]
MNSKINMELTYEAAQNIGLYWNGGVNKILDEILKRGGIISKKIVGDDEDSRARKGDTLYFYPPSDKIEEELGTNYFLFDAKRAKIALKHLAKEKSQNSCQ